MDEHQSQTADRLNTTIYALLGAHRMSQAQLGDVIGLSQGQISQRLAGHVSWRINELDQIAAHFDKPITTLLGGMLDSLSTL